MSVTPVYYLVLAFTDVTHPFPSDMAWEHMPGPRQRKHGGKGKPPKVAAGWMALAETEDQRLLAPLVDLKDGTPQPGMALKTAARWHSPSNSSVTILLPFGGRTGD